MQIILLNTVQPFVECNFEKVEYDQSPLMLKYRNIQSMIENRLKETRESLLMSKAELARRAKISPITISRIESGMPCRMDTKRKIILALGLRISDKDKIFKD